MAQSYDCVHCGHYVLDDPSHFYACQRCVSADETLVGDKDRDNAIARLTAAHAGGYLSLEKFDERVSLLLQPDIAKSTLKQALAGTPSPAFMIISSPLPWWKRVSRVNVALAVVAVTLFALLMAGL